MGTKKQTIKRETQNLAQIEEAKIERGPDDIDPHLWKDNLEEYHLQSMGIQVVLINDAEGVLVPTLDFTIYELTAGVLMVPDKLTVGGSITLSSSYFNPEPSKWEPIIEKFGLDFEVTQQENPQLSLILTSKENFEEMNINVSEEMLKILYTTMTGWKANYDEQTKSENKNKKRATTITQDNQEEVIDYVSPYTIINETGYMIEVQEDVSAKKHDMQSKPTHKDTSSGQVYKIGPGEQAEYLLESDLD
mmetsp:Transcript_20208/g.17386  ORF Transcript_20208/g.17386 Transcript_20208/m.17386 type:complete len:248 (+) Transcript_20208:1078-1821(+)